MIDRPDIVDPMPEDLPFPGEDKPIYPDDGEPSEPDNPEIERDSPK